MTRRFAPVRHTLPLHGRSPLEARRAWLRLVAAAKDPQAAGPLPFGALIDAQRAVAGAAFPLADASACAMAQAFQLLAAGARHGLSGARAEVYGGFLAAGAAALDAMLGEDAAAQSRATWNRSAGED